MIAYCTHGVLSGAAVQRVDKSELLELVITDSIAAYESAEASDKVRILTDRAAARRGDPPHRRRDLRLQPVRLRNISHARPS